MSRVIVSREKLVAVADAIRTKGATTNTLTLDEMPEAIANMEGSGTGSGVADTRFKELVEGTVTQIEDGTIVKVRDYAFYGVDGLSKAYFPNATSFAGYAFYDCQKLTEISREKLKTIGSYAFYNCLIMTVGSFPQVTSVGSYSFRQCRKIGTFSFPSLVSTANYAFSRCSALVKADLGLVSSLAANLFAADWLLATLILIKSDSIASLAATSAFSGTGIAKGTGYVYVPKDLVDTYKSATNWSTYANQFRAIEDYPEITGG